MAYRHQAPPCTRPAKLQLTPPKIFSITPTLPLFSFQNNNQDIVRLSFIAQKPTPKEKKEEVLNYFIAKLLTEGTQKKTKKQIAKHIDQYGASLFATTNKDTLQLQLLTLHKHFPKLIALFAEILQKPAFTQPALTLEKNITSQDIQLRNATLPALAQKILYEKTFGAKHPYSYALEKEDLSTITTEALQQTFKKSAWQKPYCILSGNITPTIIKATQQALHNIPQHDNNPTKTYTPQPNTQTHHIPHKEAVQTSIAFGMPTITRTHADYPLLYIVNTILGGYFGARLMQNIREEKGYTYGISSRLTPLKNHTLLSINSEIKKGFATQTEKEIVHEIKKLQEETIPTHELDSVKNFLSGQLIAKFDNTFSLAKHFSQLHLQNLNLTYYSNLYNTLQTISPESLQKIAQKYLPTTHLSKVIINA